MELNENCQNKINKFTSQIKIASPLDEQWLHACES